MIAFYVVFAFMALIIGVVVWSLRDNGEHAPKWLLDDEPHNKYDEQD